MGVGDLERKLVSSDQEQQKEPSVLPPSLEMFLPPPQPNLVQSGLMNPAGLGLSNLGNQPWPQTGLGFGPSPLGGLPPHPFCTTWTQFRTQSIRTTWKWTTSWEWWCPRISKIPFPSSRKTITIEPTARV